MLSKRAIKIYNLISKEITILLHQAIFCRNFKTKGVLSGIFGHFWDFSNGLENWKISIREQK